MPRTVLNYTYIPNPPFSNNQNGCVDWQNGLGYFFSGDFYCFNLSTQAQIRHISGAFPNINTTESAQTISVSPGDGLIYTCSIINTNLVMGYDPTTGALTKNFDNTGGLVPAPGNCCANTASGANVVVCAGLNCGQGSPPDGAPIFVINMDTSTPLAGTTNVDEYQTSIAPGNAFVGRGALNTAYAASLGIFGRPTGTPSTMGFYRINMTNTSFTMTRIGGYVAAGLGLAGTINNVGSPTVDLSDNNILVPFSTTGPSASFLAKFDGVSGALIWIINTNQMLNLAECRIRHGQLQYLSTATSYVTVNLATGATVTDTVSPATGATSRVYFDDTRVLLVFNNNNNPFANPQWQTLGLPPSPLVIGGGVIRLRG